MKEVTAVDKNVLGIRCTEYDSDTAADSTLIDFGGQGLKDAAKKFLKYLRNVGNYFGGSLIADDINNVGNQSSPHYCVSLNYNLELVQIYDIVIIWCDMVHFEYLLREPDVPMKIFCLLSLEDVLHAELVSKKWRTFLIENSIWRRKLTVNYDLIKVWKKA